MARKKSYLITDIDSDNVTSIATNSKPPEVIRLPKSTHYIRRNLDFTVFYGRGADDLIKHLHSALWEIYCSNTKAHATIESYYGRGLFPFVDFLELWAKNLDRELLLSDLNLDLINRYIHHLGTRMADGNTTTISYLTQKNHFSAIRSIIDYLCNKGVLPTRHLTIPANPFPSASRLSKGEKLLSESERRRLHQALHVELELIRTGQSSLINGEKLAVYIFLIATTTGKNTMPLLEMSRDALRPHPISEDRWLLSTTKYRAGGKVQTQTFKDDGNDVVTVKSGVVSLIREVLDLTSPLVEKAPPELRDFVWLYTPQDGAYYGKILNVNSMSLGRSSSAIAKKHNLTFDDGTPFRITVGSLRKTFVNRLWRLSGGDPLITAKLAGHSVDVSNSHYLAVTPEMEKNHKFCGEALVKNLQGIEDEPRTINIVPTGVSSCSDPKNGRYAPKNGDYCTEFLSCFKCPNQIITNDDLYRLFSFYWLLVKERKFLGGSRWEKIYRWVIRDIDELIAPKFPLNEVNSARKKAEIDPHPMWRDRTILRGSDD
jgi:integrase